MSTLIIFLILLVLFLLLAFGLIGPKWLKRRVQKLNVWYYTRAVLFFPTHPYKPLREALKEGVKEFFPTRERIKNVAILSLFWAAVVIIIFIATIIIVNIVR